MEGEGKGEWWGKVREVQGMLLAKGIEERIIGELMALAVTILAVYGEDDSGTTFLRVKGRIDKGLMIQGG